MGVSKAAGQGVEAVGGPGESQLQKSKVFQKPNSNIDIVDLDTCID